jgi:hypothetical protein
LTAWCQVCVILTVTIHTQAIDLRAESVLQNVISRFRLFAHIIIRITQVFFIHFSDIIPIQYFIGRVYNNNRTLTNIYSQYTKVIKRIWPLVFCLQCPDVIFYKKETHYKTRTGKKKKNLNPSTGHRLKNVLFLIFIYTAITYYIIIIAPYVVYQIDSYSCAYV